MSSKKWINTTKNLKEISSKADLYFKSKESEISANSLTSKNETSVLKSTNLKSSEQDFDSKSSAAASKLDSVPKLKLNFSNYPAYKLTSLQKNYLPYSLNYKIFEKLVLVSLLSLFLNNVSEASTARLSSNSALLTSITSKKSQSSTEASTCLGCAAAAAPKSDLSKYLSQLPIVKNGDAKVHNSAYYTDNANNRKKSILELRRRKENGETLTKEENAILKAAGQTGLIVLCKGVASNAFLVNIPVTNSAGKTVFREAVITSGHLALDSKTGKTKCNGDFSNVKYHADYSFFDGSDNFDYRTVGTNGELPLNLENVIGKKNIPPGSDFLVFFLDEKAGPISQDRLPDGSTRGALNFSSKTPRDENVYMIGLDPKFENGLYSAYQKCKSDRKTSTTIYHSCDSIKGVSSSLLTSMENGELTFRGIHSFGDQTEGPLPNSPALWNMGESSEHIQKFLTNQEDLTN